MKNTYCLSRSVLNMDLCTHPPHAPAMASSNYHLIICQKCVVFDNQGKYYIDKNHQLMIKEHIFYIFKCSRTFFPNLYVALYERNETNVNFRVWTTKNIHELRSFLLSLSIGTYLFYLTYNIHF